MTPEQRSVYESLRDDLLVRAAQLHYEGATELPLQKVEFIALMVMRELAGQWTADGKTALWYFMGLKIVKDEKRSH